jgi:hypothetical protein
LLTLGTLFLKKIILPEAKFFIKSTSAGFEGGAFYGGNYPKIIDYFLVLFCFPVFMPDLLPCLETES